MRLLKVFPDEVDSLKLELTRLEGQSIPKYAILSHTWSQQADDEVFFEDVIIGTASCKPGFSKITSTLAQAREEGHEYVWIDTCCINKDSSAELQEAINSMYQWYHNAATCYVYLADVDEVPPNPWRGYYQASDGYDLKQALLADESTFTQTELDFSGKPENQLLNESYFSNQLVPPVTLQQCVLKSHRNACLPVVLDAIASEGDRSDGARCYSSFHKFKAQFLGCRWFTRGWTLQELLAPEDMQFFSQDWSYIGRKYGLCCLLSKATGIDVRYLTHDLNMTNADIATRMSWAANRETTRDEDIAYCLMGIFAVNMGMLYGEGDRAFIRLQEEIMRQSADHSLFMWKTQCHPLHHRGLLADHPKAFRDAKPTWRDYSVERSDQRRSFLSNQGLAIHLRMRSLGNGYYVAGLQCREYTSTSIMGIYMRRTSIDQYARVFCDRLVDDCQHGEIQEIVVPQKRSVGSSCFGTDYVAAAMIELDAETARRYHPILALQHHIARDTDYRVHTRSEAVGLKPLRYRRLLPQKVVDSVQLHFPAGINPEPLDSGKAGIHIYLHLWLEDKRVPGNRLVITLGCMSSPDVYDAALLCFDAQVAGVMDHPKPREDLPRSFIPTLHGEVVELLVDEPEALQYRVRVDCKTKEPPLPAFRDTWATTMLLKEI